jgi:hypothetical protein
MLSGNVSVGKHAVADQHARAADLIGAFEARRQIHSIADHRIVAGLLRADTANHNIASRDANAYAVLRETTLEAGEVGQLDTKRDKASKLIECSETGELGWFLGASEGWTLKGHDGITDVCR